MATSTKAERDRNESRNIRALGDFRNYWETNGEPIAQNATGLRFKAQVSYDSPRRSIVQTTDVRIALRGYGTDGQIDIDETPRMDVDDFHLRANAAFGRYQLDEDSGELVVSGDSPEKMGGKYSIRILPLGPASSI